MTSFVNPDGLRRLCRADSRARKRLGRYSDNTPVLTDLSCCPAYISKSSNLSSTPRSTAGSHQAAGGIPATRGISPLAWFSRDRPHCLRRLSARSDIRLDGSIIVPAAGHGRTGSRPVPADCCFSLLAWGRRKNRILVQWFLIVPFSKSPRSCCLGSGFRQSSGNVPDEWVCGFQGAGRSSNRASHSICR